MNILIIKLGATGDVVRTTPLLRRFDGAVTWITAAKNVTLLEGLQRQIHCISWEQRQQIADADYDLVINLEDTLEVAQFLSKLKFKKLFGAYTSAKGALIYNNESHGWFDLSLISAFGKEQADILKLRNRRTYQELIFKGLGLSFAGETYLLPEPVETGLSGDVAIAPEAGAVWPMKKWAYYDQLKRELEVMGLTVNVLPQRPSLLEHLCDVRNHRVLVSGDSLPMHLALGSGTRCVTLFNCTSPWEIHDYGIQRKIVSPLLEQFFYKRGHDERATAAITLKEVLDATVMQLQPAKPETAAVSC